ncbi:MAG: biopolymer transporter ExbD, partial [Pseudomonadota bacterium]
MALRRVRRRGRSSITSLIDVIFLLLLFFMLASTFTRFSEVDIAAASASD